MNCSDCGSSPVAVSGSGAPCHYSRISLNLGDSLYKWSGSTESYEPSCKPEPAELAMFEADVARDCSGLDFKDHMAGDPPDM